MSDQPIVPAMTTFTDVGRLSIAPSTGVQADSLAAMARAGGAEWLQEKVAAAFFVGVALDLAPPLKKTSPQTHDVASLLTATTKLVVLPLRRSASSSSPIITIGRMNGNDVCIPHPDVSRFHAFLCEGEGFALVDADSTNGTLVDGSPAPRRRSATPPARLRSRSLIRFGPVAAVFVDAMDANAMLQGLLDGVRPVWLSGLTGSTAHHEASDHRDEGDLHTTRRMRA